MKKRNIILVISFLLFLNVCTHIVADTDKTPPSSDNFIECQTFEDDIFTA